jgi:hypothetical protein
MIPDPGRVAPRAPLPAGAGEFADLLFLLRVDADHRVPGRQVLVDLAADVAELGVPVRVLLALDRLGVALQAEPLSARSRLPTVPAGTGWPCAVSSAASVRVDLTVHRKGDSGSPRSSGSTSASSAGTSPGSVSAAGLRPPPGCRTRPSGSAPASSSATPADTVPSRTPAARATSRTPP